MACQQEICCAPAAALATRVVRGRPQLRVRRFPSQRRGNRRAIVATCRRRTGVIQASPRRETGLGSRAGTITEYPGERKWSLTAIDLSGDVGLVALSLLTLNLLLGLLISTRYSPWRSWPHRRINIFRIHNQTGIAALSASALHPLILLLSATAGFGWLDLVFPAWAPSQPTINLLGAAGLYCLVLVVVTSQYRVELGRRRWKTLHYTTYAVAGFVFVHSLLTDPLLKNSPVDFLDGEKLFVGACILLVAAGTALRIRYALRKRRAALGKALDQAAAAESGRQAGQALPRRRAGALGPEGTAADEL